MLKMVQAKPYRWAPNQYLSDSVTALIRLNENAVISDVWIMDLIGKETLALTL